MTASNPPYTTQELTTRTWPDFEDLFSRGNGWDHCWCIAFHRQRPPFNGKGVTRAARSVRNHEAKKRLVETDRAHGILVYSDVEAVGWCQFGLSQELKRVGDRLTKQASEEEGRRLWRITCFVTDKRHRRRGVAAIALRAVLRAIAEKGGGLVEAYPIAHWEVDRELGRLIRKHGRRSDEVAFHRANRAPSERFVKEVGPVRAAHGTFGNVSTQGTVSMFEKEGFVPVAVLASSRVLMQRVVAGGVRP